MITIQSDWFYPKTKEETERAMERLKLLTDSMHHDRATRGEDGCMVGRGGKCVLCGTGDCLRRAD